MSEKNVLEEIMEPVTDPTTEEIIAPQGEEETSSPDEKKGDATLPIKPTEEDPIDKRFDDLEQANKGLLKELTKERSKRQNLEGRFTQINEFLSTAEQHRRQQAAEAQQQQVPVIDDLDVEFTEDEKPIIKSDKIRNLIQTELAPLHREIYLNRNQQLQQSQADSTQLVAESVISEDPNYQAGMQKLTNEWAWINRSFDEYISLGNRPPQTQQEAVEMLYASGLESEFEKAHPGSDFETVADAFMTSGSANIARKLRKALKHTVKSLGEKDPLISLDQAKKLGSKSNFTKVPNSKKSSMNLENIADLPLESLLSLTEDQAERLYDLMDTEE